MAKLWKWAAQAKFVLRDTYCRKGKQASVFQDNMCSCHLDSYWNDEEQTKSVMRKDEDGTLWMHTGDEGIMDEDGYLRGAYHKFTFLA
jgi:acyl-coenzyme A synthetase/AMP-(fatty) acid ligase